MQHCLVAQKNNFKPDEKHGIHAPAWKPIKERDILWKNTVWADIDSRDRGNEVFGSTATSNSNSLINVLLDGIKTGKLVAYVGDHFGYNNTITGDTIMNFLAPKAGTQRIIDPGTGDIRTVSIPSEFNPAKICKYRVREHWMLDENECKLTVRIIGIAPLAEVKNETDNSVTYQPMFWVYYPNAKDYLSTIIAPGATQENNPNWFDILENRNFSYDVVKISDRTYLNTKYASSK